MQKLKNIRRKTPHPRFKVSGGKVSSRLTGSGRGKECREGEGEKTLASEM